ncbi:MAG: Gfo/Idh/MocA family oxidoreductase [Clostridiaceae bacterium]|nr:Gfo/Idh/MocA family oxidoreductase [Clostridiaceae bacterium]
MSSVVNWGLIGGSNILEHATGLALKETSNAKVYALATKREERHQKFRKIFGDYKEYNDYDMLLKDEKIDAVYISLPNSLHYEWTIKALHAGKHVLCEKPISVTESKVVNMFSVARKTNCLLMEGFAFLHSPIMNVIKNICSRLGSIHFIHAHFYDEGNIKDEKNATVRRHSYGGSVYDIGCYNSAFLQFLLEEEPDQILGHAHFTKFNIDDFASFLFIYESGVKASVESYIGCSQRDDSITIFGNNGKLIIPLEYNFAGKSQLIFQNKDGATEKIDVESPNNYRLEFEHFSDCILNGKTPDLTADFSIKQARTIDRMLKTINY